MARAGQLLPFAQVRERLAALPQPLREHVARVAAEAVSLAHRHGADPMAADFAALAHDLSRADSPQHLVEQARAYGLPLDGVRERLPLLIHGPVTAEWLRRELGVADEDILNSIRYHTTARPGMSLLEMVLFVADKTEPGREGEYPHWAQVRGRARKDLEQAVLWFLEGQAESLRARGLLIHGDTEAALGWLRSRRRQARASTCKQGGGC